MPKASRPLDERFWEKVEKSDGCWLWKAAINHGYGVIGAGGRRGRILIASRVSWELNRGPIPAGVDVLHRCDNPPCVNPDHLFLGSAQDNGRDASRKGRFRPVQKISEGDVIAIRKQAAEGLPQALIGDRYGIGQSQVSRIVRGQSWTNIPVLSTGPGRRHGEKVHGVRLTEDQVRAIRGRTGVTQVALAAEHGVTVQTVADILHRRTWKHVA